MFFSAHMEHNAVLIYPSIYSNNQLIYLLLQLLESDISANFSANFKHLALSLIQVIEQSPEMDL